MSRADCRPSLQHGLGVGVRYGLRSLRPTTLRRRCSTQSRRRRCHGCATFNLQGLANTAWAFTQFAKADHAAPARAVRRDRRGGSATAARLRPDDPQALANIAGSFAKAAHHALAHVGCSCRGNRGGGRCCGCATSTFKPQELASTAWSFATAGRPATAQKSLKNQVKPGVLIKEDHRCTSL